VIGAIQSLSKLRGLIIVPIMLRSFGAHGFGVWVQSILLVSLLSGISQGSLHAALLRYLPGANQMRRNEVVWNGLAWVATCSLAMATVVAIFGGVAAERFLALPSDLLWGVGALVLLRSLAQYVSNICRADNQGRRFAILDLVPMLTELVAVVIAAVMDTSLTFGLTLMVAIETIYVAILMVWALRPFSWVRPTWASLVPLLRYSLPGIPISVSSFLLSFADRYVIGATLGATAVGLYSAAYALASLPTFLTKPIIVQLLPAAAAAWNAGDHAGAVKFLRDNTRLYSVLGLPVVVGIAIVGPDVLRLMGGGAHGEWSVGLLVSVGAGAWVYGLLLLALHGYHLQERMASTAWNFLSAAALNLTLNFILLPLMGVVGAGIATTVAYAAVFVPVALKLKKTMGPILDWVSLAKATVAAASMGAVIWYIPHTRYAGLVLTVSVGVIVYTAFSFLLGLVSKSDAQRLSKRLVKGVS